MDVVITDHHQPAADLPRAVAHVNPWLGPSPSCGRELAGVGVAFKLVWALCQKLSRAKKLSPEFRQFLLESLALVALGTISDVVPLRGESRVLARHGLPALQSSRRPGIRRLVAAALGVDRSRKLEASHVGFRLGPRLNAAGRLGRADLAMNLLATGCEAEAARLMDTLERENRKRREIQERMQLVALERIREQVDLERDRAIVLADREWHPGVLGIVAARLAEEFYRPTLLFAIQGDRCRGSARSVAGVHICNALGDCREHLQGYGGHALAAGVECGLASLERLRQALNVAIDLAPLEMVPAIEVDCEVSLSQIGPQLLEELSRLSPFGESNPEPLLAARDLEVVGAPRLAGEGGKHLCFFVREHGVTFRAVAFGQGSLLDSIDRRAARVSLLFQPRWNHWRGRREIELYVRELAVGDAPYASPSPRAPYASLLS
jgi:single-stranded-DNA-specific exonuclease